MIIGKKPSIITTRIRGNTDQLPMELDISTSLLAALPNVAVGVIFAALGFNLYGNVPASTEFGSVIAFVFQAMPIVFIVAGLAVLVRGVAGLTDRRIVRIDDHGVTVSAKSLFRSQNWSEPLDAFDGVRWRQIVVRVHGNRGSSSSTIRPPRVYYVLDLKHPDAARCIPLHVTRLDGAIRPKWEHLAKLLNVPAIDERGGETRVRAAEDVDKSIRELTEEGKLEVEWDDRPPPAGLDLAHEGDAADTDSQVIVVTILARRFPLWLYGAVLVPGAFMLVAGALDLALFPVLFGGGLGAAVIWHWKYEARNPRTVRITRSGVDLETPNPGNPPKRGSVRHSAIESVDIRKQDGDSRGFLGAQLVIVSDQGEHKTGAGLSREGLVWLRDLILAAVAKA